MRKRNFNNKYLKNILTLLTGTTLAQAVPIAIAPILTRIYSPDDFGVWALYTAILSIFTVLINGRYELALMLPKEDEDAINILALSVLIAFIISLVLMIIVLFYGSEIALFLGNKSIHPWLYFLPFSVFISGIYQAFTYWSNRKQFYKRLAINKVIQSTSNAGFNLLGNSIREGSFGLIMGTVLSQLFVTAKLCYESIKKDKMTLGLISLVKIKNLTKRYDQFPKISLWSGLLNVGSVNMPIFLLSSFFNSTIVGWYSLSNRILSMPMTIIGSAVGQVFFQSSSVLKIEDSDKLRVMAYKTYKYMIFIGLIPMSIFFGFGDVIFKIIFGEDWVVAGQFARFLSVWLLFVFASSPLSLIYTVMEKEGSYLIFNIIMFISRGGALLVGAVYFGDYLLTIILFSLVGTLFWFWNCFYTLKLVGISYLRSIVFTTISVSVALSTITIIRFIIVGSIF